MFVTRETEVNSMKKKKVLSLVLVFILAASVFTACGYNNQIIDLGAMPEAEMVPLSTAPAVSTLLMPVASGTDVKKNQKAEIDVSNRADGYVMVKYLGGNANLRVLITVPSKVTYTYRLRSDGVHEVFPLSDGNGAYSIGVYKNISGNQFSTEFTTSINVTLKDEFAPFLRPNQYVNFNSQTLAVVKARELVAGSATTLAKVEKIYSHVITNFTYDKKLAETVQSGYVPDLNAVWNKKTGICFDYASLVTAMLRSQGIPSRLVIGYTGQVYHAWISVYTTENGWVEGAIFFDGKTWRLMDPTFASSGNSSEAIMKYIGDGKNYSARFLY